MSKEFTLDLFARQLVDRKVAGRPYVVGITGFDGSGKTTLTTQLAVALGGLGLPVQIVHVDDFHHPRAVRYAGSADEPWKYVNQSFDFDGLRREVLVPIAAQGALQLSRTGVDVASDRLDAVTKYDVGPETMVLVEGVFLLRPEIRELLDFVLFLEASDEFLTSRGVARDLRLLRQETSAKFRDKYLPAQHWFHARNPPTKLADLIVQYDDPAHSTVTKGWTACAP